MTVSTILVYIWLLFSQPHDHLICSMWLSHAPTQDDMTAAGCVFTPEEATGWFVRAYNWRTHQIACDVPASALPGLPCNVLPVDDYLIQVHDPNYTEQLCDIQITHSGEPTPAEIIAACPSGILDRDYSMQWVSTGEIVPPVPPAPVCPMPDLTSDDLRPLSSSQDLHLLDLDLYWYYGQFGMGASWQNRYDASIYQAGTAEKVPPYVIKEMIMQESQFWPLLPQSIDQDLGEVGLGQLTDAGADLVIRYDQDIYSAVCAIAAPPDDCARGYDLLSPYQRLMVRNVFRRSLMVYGTAEDAARQADSQMDIWARVMKAYYCASGEIVDGWGDRPTAERWDMTLAAYHAGLNCLIGGEICLEGQKYLDEVHK